MSSVQLKSLAQNRKSYINDIISDITAQVRAAIWNNQGITLSSDPSLIPPELMATTCHLIIEALQSRIPTLELSDDQVRNADNARAFLNRIADGKSSIMINKGQITRNPNVFAKRQRLATQTTLLGL